MFHYRDGEMPQTPEPESQPEELQPPPPPRQVMKVRRRRTTFVMNDEQSSETQEQLPIPTIEQPELLSEASLDLPSFPVVQDSAYLSPGMGFTRMLSPPKTPIAQMRTISSYDGPQNWGDIEAGQSETSSRPASSSGFSDSSVSSCGSIGSFTSRGGSCTSPEDEMTDPFPLYSPAVKYSNGPLSPFSSHQEEHPAKKLKLRATFTEEMDHHLWMTYMNYLQDPTVTPFKSLPSFYPPNGVCHRVARMARNTWTGARPSRFDELRSGSQRASRAGTPDTIRPTKSGSTTPVARPSKAYLRFPSEKQCRKRLRDLAKQKSTFSAHYQRLLHRSPSPLSSSPPREASQPVPVSSPFPPAPSAFSTRDMNFSLATSTATTMQAGNPLAQLASENTKRPSERNWSSVRSSAHQKSQSLHLGLGLGIGNVLGTPFMTNNNTSSVEPVHHNAQTWHAQSSMQPPRLGSPFQIHAPRPISKVFKRRALHNFEDKARSRGESFVSELFGAPAESSHRRVRSRGFSLGDMMEGARRAPFMNGSAFDPFVENTPPLPTPAQEPSQTPSESLGHSTIRLGSPFGSRSSNTFPRATTSHSFEPAVSFEQRFAALPSDPASLHRS